MIKARKAKDAVSTGLIVLCTAFAVGILVLILVYILANGLSHVDWAFLSTPYQPGLGNHGIINMIVSTLLLAVLTLLISTPLGILAAIYLTEYAKKGKLLNIIRFATESLAGIPSILYGLFGFALFVTFFKLGFTILAGALTLSVMVLPIVVRTTEEALLAVPNSYREGSLALGASKLTTIARVVLPSCISGILTSVILSIGRIVGETAALIYTMGSAVGMPSGFLSSGRTLSVHLYFLAKEGTSVDQSYAAAAVLLILVAIINALAMFTASRLRRKGKKGAK